MSIIHKVDALTSINEEEIVILSNLSTRAKNLLSKFMDHGRGPLLDPKKEYLIGDFSIRGNKGARELTIDELANKKCLKQRPTRGEGRRLVYRYSLRADLSTWKEGYVRIPKLEGPDLAADIMDRMTDSYVRTNYRKTEPGGQEGRGVSGQLLDMLSTSAPVAKTIWEKGKENSRKDPCNDSHS